MLRLSRYKPFTASSNSHFFVPLSRIPSKCGTSTLMANLGHLAPMPVKDVCVGPGMTLKLAYQQWPTLFGGNLTRSIIDNDTLLRGSKCPRHISDWGVRSFANSFQKTKFIVGIRWVGYVHFSPGWSRDDGDGRMFKEFLLLTCFFSLSFRCRQNTPSPQKQQQQKL
jgi:hypothetical protein